MSDGEVRATLEQMEAWLADPNWEPEPEALAQWNPRFQSALAQTEKGQDWPELRARAHNLGQHLEVRIARLAQLQDGVKTELDALERGNRALKGYGDNTR